MDGLLVGKTYNIVPLKPTNHPHESMFTLTLPAPPPQKICLIQCSFVLSRAT